MLTTVSKIFYLELIILLRRSHEWLYPLGFFIIVISFFPLAISPDNNFLQKIIPGVVWIACLFASLLSIQSVFNKELEDGNLELMLLSQLPLPLLIFLKMLAYWLVAALPLIILAPCIGWLLNLQGLAIGVLFLSLLLGTPVLILMGGLGAALTLNLRQQGILLSLIILPLITPILIFGVNLVQQNQAGLSIKGPLAFLAALCVLALTLLPGLIAMTLRISLDD